MYDPRFWGGLNEEQFAKNYDFIGDLVKEWADMLQKNIKYLKKKARKGLNEWEAAQLEKAEEMLLQEKNIVKSQ